MRGMLNAIDRSFIYSFMTEESELMRFYITGRQRWTNGNPETRRQTLGAGGSHLMGYWLRGTQSTWSIHAYFGVQRLDQPNYAVLSVVLLSDSIESDLKKLHFNLVSHADCRTRQMGAAAGGGIPTGDRSRR